MERLNGVTCIKGEIHSIITIMRLNSRWSQSTRISRESLYNDEGSLMKSFRKLNEYLEGIFDLSEVDCVAYIVPFYDVIISDKANGPLTGAALSALSKFALYGFLSEQYPRVEEGMSLVANCISHCVFEETDWESDELILIKLLELSELCYRCAASSLLTAGAAWDIYSTCISIHNHYRASKILKSEAANVLVHLTLNTYGRVAQLAPVFEQNGQNTSDVLFDAEVSAQKWDTISQKAVLGSQRGIVLLAHKILTVLSDLSDVQRHNADTVKFSLSLVNVALEAGGLSVGAVPVLVELLRNDICRNLLRASQSDDLAILSLALRVVFNLFASIKEHMKVQLEVFVTSVHLRLINGSGSLVASSAKEELALESLLEFCREPSLMQDLYSNYDCDVQCTNLFDSIILALCVRALPRRLTATMRSLLGTAAPMPASSSPTLVSEDAVTVASPGVNDMRLNILNKLAFDGLLTVLHSVASKCSSDLYVNKLPSAVKHRLTSDLESRDTPEKINLGLSGLNSDIFRSSDSLVGTVSLPSSALKVYHAAADSQVDRWCESDDSASFASSDTDLESYSVPHFADASTAFSSPPKNARSLSNVSASRWELVSQESGSSSHLSGLHGGPTPVDGENEVTMAVLEAKARTAEVLRERKMMKQKFKLAGDKFNSKPLKNEWVQFAIDLGILKPAAAADRDGDRADLKSDTSLLAEAKSVAEFLRYTPGLGKVQVGEYISKGPADLFPFNAAVLREYVRLFDFSGPNSSFDKALRMFLGHFRLPGEAQCIDRIMEAFAGHLFEHLGPHNPFATADAAFILSFSTILLNTDLHNPGIPVNKKMTKLQFVRNNRGINDGADLPLEYLEALYDEIKDRQIQLDIGMGDAGMQGVDYTDAATWNKLILQGSADQAPAVFTPTIAARKGAVLETFLSSAESSLALQDRDMFLIMARPLLETMVALWDHAADDLVLGRIFRGLWDYALVSMNLDLHCMASSLIQLLAMKSRESLSHSRSAPLKPYSRRNALAYRSHYTQWQAESGHDLHSLLLLDVSTLVRDNKSDALREHTALTNINWCESSLVRGELLLKIVFQGALRCSQSLSEAAWRSVFELLLFCRSRGALPLGLAVVVDDFTASLAASETLGLVVSEDLPSAYSRQSYLHAYGISTTSVLTNGRVGLGETANKSKVAQQVPSNQTPTRGGSWMSNIGGFLLSVATANLADSHSVDGLSSTGSVVHDIHSDATTSLLNASELYKNTNACRFAHLNGDLIRMDDELLRNSLAVCDIEGLLFGVRSGVPAREEEVVAAQVGALLFTLSRALEGFSKSSSHGTRDVNLANDMSDSTNSGSYFPHHLTTAAAAQIANSTTNAQELDLVLLIEWIFRLVSVNTSRLQSFWPKLHTLFKLVFEDRLDQLSVEHPYFLERCVTVILRSAILLVNAHCSAAHHKEDVHLHLSSSLMKCLDNSGQSSGRSADSVWMSLRLMRGLSGEVVSNLSGRIGLGVFTLIRAVHVHATSVSLDQWYMVFSLLSAATSGAEGRDHVWGAVSFLIERGMVNEINFTPCRHLLMRFLHGVFPGEAATEKDSSSQWLLPSIEHLMTLTLMALAGNIPSLPSTSSSAAASQSHVTPVKLSRPPAAAHPHSQASDEVVHFAMPPPYLFSPLDKSIATKINSSSISSSGSCAAPNEIRSVRRVQVGKVEELELLWLETCKVYCELANSANQNVSLRAIYCLRAVVLSGRTAQLADAAWLKCLNELISRLPVLFVTSASRLGAQQHQTAHDTLDTAVDCCQRSCNVVYDVLLDSIRRLRGDVEFQSIWIRFVGTLSTNAAVAGRSAALHGLQDEMADMLEAMLRLLRTPPTTVIQVAAPAVVLVPQQSSAQSSGAEMQPSQGSIFNVFGWFAAPPAQPNTSPPPAPQPQSQSQSSLAQSAAPGVSTTSKVVFDLDCDPRLHDGSLLVSCWRAVHSGYPQLESVLRVKNPKLLSSIQLFMECSDGLSLRKRQEFTCEPTSPNATIATVTPPKEIQKSTKVTPPIYGSGKNSSCIQTV